MSASIVPSTAAIEKLAGDFQFTEGPVWMDDGYLLFSDIPRNAIYRWTPDGQVSVFREPSGWDGSGAPAGALIGSNGLTLDLRRRLLICEHGNRRVSRLEPDGRLTVLAAAHERKRLNSPNDIVCKSDGSIYFTDPPYGLPGRDEDPAKELPYSGIYRLAPEGSLSLLYRDLARPNGLAFSPDERYLYVSNSEPERRIWMRFEVDAGGAIGNGAVFFDATAWQEPGNPDGMKLDQEGNLYCTGPGGIWIFSPDGAHLGTLRPPEIPANLAWGDADGRTLYITARTGLYRVRLNVPGIRP